MRYIHNSASDNEIYEFKCACKHCKDYDIKKQSLYKMFSNGKIDIEL